VTSEQEEAGNGGNSHCARAYRRNVEPGMIPPRQRYVTSGGRTSRSVGIYFRSVGTNQFPARLRRGSGELP